MKRTATAVFSLAVMTPLVVPAQPRPAPGSSRGAGPAPGAPQGAAARLEAEAQQVRRYDFDNDEVLGALARPDGVAVNGRGRLHHPSLLRPRQSFVPELIKSVADL